eukprot:NODE_227_length_13866_cov_0.400305.p6 type:complete len:273 gc:universal NODE_227_length_13866_cov_0.400305:9922-10740(+)
MSQYTQLSDEDIHKLKLERFFGFQPDLNLCYIAIAVLGLLTVVLTAQNIWMMGKKKYLYMYVLTGSGLAEIAGYVGRIVTINDPTLPNFIFMDVFLLLTPIALAYFEYKTVGKLMVKIKLEKAFGFIPAKWVSLLFVFSDFVSFVVQSAAAGYLTSGDENLEKIGKAIMLTGLGIQIVFFTFFFILMTHVFIKSKGMWVPFLSLYIQMGCLYTRGVYRIIEFASSHDSEVNQHEYYFYIFDSLMITICFVSYIVFYAPKFLNKEYKSVVYPS